MTPGLSVRMRPGILLFAVILPAIGAGPATRAGDQAVRAAFDYRSELGVAHDAAVLARGDFDGDGVPDLLVAGPGRLTVFRQGSSSFSWTARSGPSAARTPFIALAGRLDADARDDLVLLCGPRPMTAEVLLTGADGIPVPSFSIVLEGEYQKGLLADPGGDGRTDLVLFGKKSPGITVLAGNGAGGFSPGVILFPDVPVSDVAVAKMDDDDLDDLVLTDWVSNAIRIVPGFGGMHFGDAAVLRFDEEPLGVSVADLNGDRKRDIVAGFAGPGEFRIFAGDGAGNYTPSGRGSLGSSPEKIRAGDIDGDARNDLLIYLPRSRSLVVRFQDAQRSFALQQSYSSGPDPADAVFFQDARKRYLNAAVLSAGESIVRILHNRSPGIPGGEEWVLATGNDPGELEVVDLNGDGWPDVALAQSTDPVLNVFLNDGRGLLRGQSSLPLRAPAGELLRLSPGRGFLTADPKGPSISFVSFESPGLSVTAWSVETGRPVEPIDALRNPDASTVRITALRGSGADGEAAVCTYEVGGRGGFESGDVALSLQGRMVAAASYDFQGDGLKDLAILSSAGRGDGSLLTVFRQSESGFPLDHETPVSIPPGTDGPDGGLALWIEDLNGDGYPDLLMNRRRPANDLLVALGLGDSAYADPVVVLADVAVPSRRSLLATDFDSDGRMDLLFVNERARTVQFLPGDGDGSFSGPVNLTSARGVKGVGVGDLNRDRENELVLAYADEGVLTVTSFHHPLYRPKRADRRSR